MLVCSVSLHTLSVLVAQLSSAFRPELCSVLKGTNAKIKKVLILLNLNSKWWYNLQLGKDKRVHVCRKWNPCVYMTGSVLTNLAFSKIFILAFYMLTVMANGCLSSWMCRSFYVNDKTEDKPGHMNLQWFVQVFWNILAENG